MPKRFTLLHMLGLLAAISCTCATLALAAQVAPGTGHKGSTPVGVIVLDAAAAEDEAKSTQPLVAFDHTLHTRDDTNGDTCASCHDATEPGVPYAFKDTAGKTGRDLENAFHDGCISCHETRKKDSGMATGPQRAECRSCHNPASLPGKDAAPSFADGGLDASLHARHVGSKSITVQGSADNCAACHHPPVDKLSSPVLKADSCRSCHTDFRVVAHATCISCHRTLASSGESGPVTCAACHDASIKAAYPKLSPVPRLEAGQPDSILMGLPPTPKDSPQPAAPESTRGVIPDERLAAAKQPRPSMPPVAFDHKRHEGTTENCTSCHHNSLQKCSNCHTPQGSRKAKNVTLSSAMHMPTSDRSCVGCHETRKLAVPECAGCHAIMPKTKQAQPNCASCHKPLTGHSAVAANAAPSAVQPSAQASAKVLGRLEVPPPASPSIEQIIADAPDKVSIGVMAREYEPAVFPHRAIIKALAEGIRKTSPGMMAFHDEPYALCASCHHNSPPNASPPSCVSCHTKGAGTTDRLPRSLPPADRPQLKAAYHQQCMTCHERMAITKPANTDCASCHAKRAPGP